MIDSLQAYRNYLQKEKNYSSHTITAYLKDISDFNVFLGNEDAAQALETVQYGQVRSWIVALVEGGISNNSVNRKISSLKSFYKFLLKSKQIEINPLQKHKSLKTPKKVQVPFSEKELEMVFEENDYPDDFEGIRNRLIIELFYTTGMRRAELISLELSNYSSYTKTLKVLVKRNKERILPLLDCTVVLLNRYLEVRKTVESGSSGNLLILNKNGHKVSETFVYRLINDYFSNVSEKVKKSPHVLRHTFATHLLNNGADLNSVKELLGHASLSSTQIYTHSSLAELKRVYQDSHPRSH